MKTLLPGDTLFLKLANTFNPRTLLLERGLDYLQEQLPESASTVVKETRALPGKASSSIKDLISGILPEEESNVIASDEDLIRAMKSIGDELRSIDKKVRPYIPKNKSSDFYLDDEDVPLGTSFNLVPPALQL